MPEQSDFLKSLNLGGGTTAPPNTPVSGGNLFSSKTAEGSSASSSDFLRSLSSPSDSSQAPSPVNGQTSSQAPSSSDQPWYSKAWEWSNTPLLDASVFGLPEDLGMGGFGRGVEHVVSGLTSPLSIALGAATFGTGGFIAGAGETALKESGEFTAAQIADAISASKIALKTAKSMPDIEPVISGALKAGGHDLDLLERARALTFPVNRDAELASEELQKNLSEVGLSEAQRTALAAGKLSGKVLPEDATAAERAAHAAEEEQARSAIATANTKIPGFSTEELKALSDTGDTVAKAKDGFRPLDDAVRDAGYDVNNWKKATAVLSDKKLDVTKDLLGGNLLQRGAFQILHKAAPDVSFGALTKAADTANTVMNWGFTYQQLETAAQMSPRFFDALKEGDADHAWEYGTEMFASGAMGALGAPHALRSAGELFNPLLGSTDVPRLSDRWLAIERVNKDREAAHAVAEQDAVNKYNTAFDLLGLKKPHPVLGLSKEDKAFNVSRIAEVQARIETETDPEKARVLHNALAEAVGGEYQTIPTPWGTPLTPEETPARANTQVVHQNDAGEVRVGSDGRPVVWLNAKTWEYFNSKAHPGNWIAGVSYSPTDVARVLSKFEAGSPEGAKIQDLLGEAQKASSHNLATVAGVPISENNAPFAIKVVGEELQHTWQRELSQNGEAETHLSPAAFDRLHGIIPSGMGTYLDSFGYNNEPHVRVLEASAKFRAGIIPEGVPDEEVVRFIKAYRKEIEAEHGKDAWEDEAKIKLVAAQHVKDIYDARRTRQVSSDDRLANSQTGQGVAGSVRQGGRGAASLDQEEPGRVRGETPEGLTSRNEEPSDLRRVYHWSRKPDSTETNPELAGTGVRGAERGRLQVPGTYFGEESYREPAVQGNAKKYFANLDYNKIYDRAKDPLGFVDQARELTRKNGDPIEYNLEKLIQEKGFSGYRAHGVIKSFEPVKVSRDYGIAPTTAEKFHDAVSKAKRAHEATGADKQLTVYDPSEYMGLSLVDKASVPGYELELVTAKDDPSWFELGFQQEGKDSSSVTQQSQKFPSKSIPFQQIKPVLDSWLEKHPKIHVMSFNQDYLNKYVRILKKAGYNVGKEPELVEGKEAYYISRPDNGLFAKEKENRAPVWYLKSNQLVDSRMSGPMPADTVLKMLENNGVKPDELKYTGLSDFLREKGKEPVRPEEVREYLAANNLQIQEVTKGGGNLEGVGNWQQRLGYLNGRIRAIEREYPDQKPTDYADMVRERDAVRQQVQEGVEKPTKFGTYTLPGGQNYREILLTLPEGARQPWGREIQYVPNAGRWELRDRGSVAGSYETNTEAEYAAKNKWGDDWRKVNTGGGDPNFRSSHWDEPNVVGHVRFNDRVGPKGEKLLHLEELQSDWHQQGRTKGYKTEVTPEQRAAAYKKFDDADRNLGVIGPTINQVLADNDYLGFDTLREAKEAIGQHPDWAKRWDVKNPSEIAALQKYHDAWQRTRTAWDERQALDRARTGGVPDAPFKKTDEWTGLFFKRMIRYAAEHGYDGISWTPGIEHFNRWGSERFDWEKTDDGKWTVAGTDQHGGNAGGVDLEGEATRRGLLNKSGGQVKSQADLRAIVHRVMQSTAGREKIDALTKKLWDRMQSETTGTSMPRKEGFESYYDQITPQVANKLGKQFGAKVGETKIDVPPRLGHEKYEYSGPELTAEHMKAIGFDWNASSTINDQARQVYRAMVNDGTPFKQAMQRYGSQSLAEHLGGKMTIPKSITETKVPYFPITDSMRESVLKQGQPLFSRESPDNGHLPPNIDDMIRNNVFKDKPKEYRDLVMSTYRNAATTAPDPQMKAAMDFIRNEHDRSFEIGSANDILQHYIDDYFQRTWDNSNPVGRVISADAKSGKFATNVTMARRRVYNSTLEGLLKSPKQLKFDIVNNMARGRAEIIKAAANRQFIRSLRDDFSRGSDGRPAVFLAGSGNVVTGQNGEDPKTFISPDRVQKVSIAQSNIDEMKKTGDFDRFLADGTIKDITPRVHPDNIGMAIDRLEKQALSKNAQYDEVGNNKLRTDLMYLKSMLANKDYSGLREFNDAQKPVYAWDPQDYVTLDHNAMRGWNFVTNDSAGHGILVDADIKVHPEFAQYLKNRLGLEESGISKNPVGKALLGAGSAAKHVLLSLSPFHMVQIGLRGVMTGINPFTLHGPDLLDGAKIDPSDPHSETKLLAMVRQGYTTGTDFRGQQQMSEGLSTGGDALRRIPGIGNMLANSMNWYQDFLFKRYIPAMKATAGEHLFDQYRASHPEWSNDRVAKAAALHANESFGGINWRAMGRSTTTQDWGRLMLLAPDWLESEMRSGARLFNREEGNIGRKQVVMMTLGMWGIARVLNTLSTGSPHLEAPFGLAVKNKEGKEIIFGMRTLPTDLLHAATDPVGFIKGRLSPTIHAGQELLTQRDSFGRKLGPEDLWADVFHNMMPIPGQAIGQAITSTGPQVGTLGQVWKAGGGTAQVYATPAQKMAAELAANHNEDGPIDRAQMDRHRRIMDLEDSVRSGETSWPELVKLAYNTDQLKESELKKIQLNLTKTKGMDSTMASLYTRASRLPAAEFFKLFDTMNNSEKTALIPLTQQVMKRYTAKAMKDMTPSERAKDPTLQRILNMMHPSGQPPPSQEQ